MIWKIGCYLLLCLYGTGVFYNGVSGTEETIFYAKTNLHASGSKSSPPITKIPKGSFYTVVSDPQYCAPCPVYYGRTTILAYKVFNLQPKINEECLCIDFLTPKSKNPSPIGQFPTSADFYGNLDKILDNAHCLKNSKTLTKAGDDTEDNEFTIIKRSFWSSKTPVLKSSYLRDESKISKIAIHTTDNKYPTTEAAFKNSMSGILYTHQEQRGWPDIGYHFIIWGGKVFEGREIKYRGCHVTGDNTPSIGIAMLGKHISLKEYQPLAALTLNNPPTPLTDADKSALVSLVEFLKKKYQIDPKEIRGHAKPDDARAEVTAKLCPGAQLYDIIYSLRGEPDKMKNKNLLLFENLLNEGEETK